MVADAQPFDAKVGDAGEIGPANVHRRAIVRGRQIEHGAQQQQDRRGRPGLR